MSKLFNKKNCKHVFTAYVNGLTKKANSQQKFVANKVKFVTVIGSTTTIITYFHSLQVAPDHFTNNID